MTSKRAFLSLIPFYANDVNKRGEIEKASLFVNDGELQTLRVKRK